VVKNIKRQRIYESPIVEFITPKNNKLIDLNNEKIQKKVNTIPMIINDNLIVKKIDWADMEVPIPETNTNKNNEEKILNSNKTITIVDNGSNINSNE